MAKRPQEDIASIERSMRKLIKRFPTYGDDDPEKIVREYRALCARRYFKAKKDDDEWLMRKLLDTYMVSALVVDGSESFWE